jgi:hypothetical protein
MCAPAPAMSAVVGRGARASVSFLGVAAAPGAHGKPRRAVVPSGRRASTCCVTWTSSSSHFPPSASARRWSVATAGPAARCRQPGSGSCSAREAESVVSVSRCHGRADTTLGARPQLHQEQRFDHCAVRPALIVQETQPSAAPALGFDRGVGIAKNGARIG